MTKYEYRTIHTVIRYVKNKWAKIHFQFIELAQSIFKLLNCLIAFVLMLTNSGSKNSLLDLCLIVYRISLLFIY